MATKLNAQLRKRLYNYIDTAIEDPQWKKELDDTFCTLISETVEAVRQKYPPHEMIVLLKYGKAEPISDRWVLIDGSYDQKYRVPTTFSTEVTYAPSYVSINIHSMEYPSLSAAYQVWNSARESYQESTAQVRSAYVTLTQKTRTMEELLDVWPEAAKVVDIKTDVEINIEAAAELVKGNQCLRKVTECPEKPEE